MAQIDTQKLDAGDRFPSLKMKLVGGGTFTLPDDLATDYAVLQLYRGKW